MSDDDDRRHTKVEVAQIDSSPEAVAAREASNGLLQFDQVIEIVREYTTPPERRFRLRPSILLSLHRTAMQGLTPYAGVFRPGSVSIGKSKHQPPGAHLVPEFVEEMCDYVNDQWDKKLAVHLCAYVMWRLNWIHPFADGNGRTSRAASYLVLSVKLGYVVPGSNTIPDQISKDKKPYYSALEVADEHWQQGALDLSLMEGLVSTTLARQLAGIHMSATGNEYDLS